MPIAAYVDTLQKLITATSFVTRTSLSFEERPPDAGLIKGNLLFSDGSQLDFKEFVLAHPLLRVVKYGYHYRVGDRLIFRYDNASDPAAKDLATFPHHKHHVPGLLASTQPSLGEVLQEIVTRIESP